MYILSTALSPFLAWNEPIFEFLSEIHGSLLRVDKVVVHIWSKKYFEIFFMSRYWYKIKLCPKLISEWELGHLPSLFSRLRSARGSSTGRQLWDQLHVQDSPGERAPLLHVWYSQSGNDDYLVFHNDFTCTDKKIKSTKILNQRTLLL